MKTSIILTSYNYGAFISQSIESVISQTISDWELIVVDDGSSDNSLEIIKSYCKRDERIKLYTHFDNKNQGLVKSILLGLEKAQNEWIVFLESDDYLASNYLEEKHNFIKKYPSCNFVYNKVKLFGDKKRITIFSPYMDKINTIWKEKEVQDVFNEFGIENIVPTFSCVMCKKEIILNCDLNPTCLPLFDYWLWWQIAENNEFGFINKELTYWRFHNNSYLQKSVKTIKHHLQRSLFVYKILKKFNRKCILSGQNKLEQNLLFSIALYAYFYLKRKICGTIKRLFMAS